MSMEEPQYIEYYYRNSEEWLLLPNDPWIQRCLSSPETMTFEDSSRFANVSRAKTKSPPEFVFQHTKTFFQLARDEEARHPDLLQLDATHHHLLQVAI